MAVIEFELRRRVPAPVDVVFARLADINGHNDWMPHRGSILRRTRQTSTGQVASGTTYRDDTAYGSAPGEIVAFEPPRELVYHWWQETRAGRLKMEGWPGYSLDALDERTTLVRHHARMHAYGPYGFAALVLRRLAVRERTATIEALASSFGPDRP